MSYEEGGTRPAATYTARATSVTIDWSLSGDDAAAFRIEGGVLRFWTPPDHETPTDVGGDNRYDLTIHASDGIESRALDITITVTRQGQPPRITPPSIVVGGGGGGGGGGPSPSILDFEWNITRDIEELDSGHDSGAWSDGATLWLAENPDGPGDAVYAYDLASGERVEDREFELDETNRAPRGLWSDRETAWVSDSGQERLFAYELASGERVEGRDIMLASRNRDARGIWSGGSTMWVLDGVRDSLFGYDLASGGLLAEYALDSANDDPRDIWSDGVTTWVSNHNPKQLFAYRLPVPGGEEETTGVERLALKRVRDEEFTRLSRASNNSPRGIWSDGEVMYVADESDDRVYSYNMPDALDARLASLSLSGVDFGEFDPGRTMYEAVVADGVTETTVAAEAAQGDARVVIDPADHDEDADGHQIAVEGGAMVTVTVTSEDESRTRVYRVQLGEAGPSATCLRGAVAVGLSLVVYEGGRTEDLVACAETRHVTALYALDDGAYVSYILGAPDFVNQPFLELFADGLAPLTALTVKSDGPTTAEPAGDGSDDAAALQPWSSCLRGDIAAGFSLLLYEGGSVEELEACARSRAVTAVYTLHEGDFISYILGAPEFVNRSFADLFPEGLAAVTPLVAKSEGPPPAGLDGGGGEN